MKYLFLIAAATMRANAASAGEATPLFAADAPIEISMTADWRKVAASKPEDAAKAGAVVVKGEKLAIGLTTRGKSRRDQAVCEFPPLRIGFVDKPPASSIFHKQETLKFVSYCKRSKSHEQVLLREYAAYRLYNELTPESFRVRLASVEYADAASGRPIIVRKGFFIEDVDDLARRVDLKEVERGHTPIDMFDKGDAARAALFQYMIANLDWSATSGAEGEDCCHNGKLIGADAQATSGLTPAPYDFDMSGFVDAPYAFAPAALGVKSVKTRLYRGFCAHNEETRAAAAMFLEKRGALEQSIETTPGLSEDSKKKALSFLSGFFETISSPAKFQKEILAKCRD